MDAAELGQLLGAFGDRLSVEQLGGLLGGFRRTIVAGGGNDLVVGGLFGTYDLGAGDNRFVQAPSASLVQTIINGFAGNNPPTASALGTLLGGFRIRVTAGGGDDSVEAGALTSVDLGAGSNLFAQSLGETELFGLGQFLNESTKFTGSADVGALFGGLSLNLNTSELGSVLGGFAAALGLEQLSPLLGAFGGSLPTAELGQLLGGFGSALTLSEQVALGQLLGGFGQSLSSADLGMLLGGFGATASTASLGSVLGGFGSVLSATQLGSLLGGFGGSVSTAQLGTLLGGFGAGLSSASWAHFWVVLAPPSTAVN